ncbi:MAG: OmpH family outer membrane protein [Gammaproteobacteria bacterium]|nr:OmpH family outer membrane protein [Gammaproteobacteria bacterium]
MSTITTQIIFFTALLLSTAVTAENHSYKIGFVNTSQVLKQAPQARKVEDRLKAEFGPREEQIKQERQGILALEEQLKTDEKLSATTRRKLEREIRLKVSQLKFLEQEFREDQNLRRNEGIRELQQVVAAVLTELGDTDKYDLILTEGVSFVSEQIDITGQVIEMLKQLPDATEETQ